MIDAMAGAYERMLERAMENSKFAADRTNVLFHEAIDKAHERAIELNEISREEADRIAAFLKRDVEDAAFYLHETGDDLKRWLGFEKEVFSDHLLHLFAQAADQTTLALQELAKRAGTHYVTNDIVAPGILVCTTCHHEVHLKSATSLPPCPACMGTHFKRKPG
jgi:hypothetical protein